MNGTEASNASARATRTICRTRVGLFPEMTLHDHLYFASLFGGVKLSNLIDECKTYEIDPWLHVRACEMSTGVARRAWILTSLARPFSVGLLDEPFLGVDMKSSDILVGVIERLARTKRILMVSHEWPAELKFDSTLALESRCV